MNFDLEPVEATTLKETVYHRLLTAIVSGKLPPGTQVTIAQLSNLIGVSFMPVREALQKLEAGSLISIQKNRRIIISELSADDLNELLRIRVNLECMAATEALKHPTDELVKNLEKIMKNISVSRNPEEFLKRNKAFHFSIYRSAKMPILQEVIEHLWRRVSPYLHIYATEATDFSDFDYLRTKYHEGILKGIREKKAKDVCKWLTLDLKTAAERVVNWLHSGRNGKNM
jgi:DNA-binding GntR family transcriptional regulator